MEHGIRRWSVALAAAIAMLAVLTSACTADQGSDPNPTQTVKAAPRPAPTQTPEVKALERRYAPKFIYDRAEEFFATDVAVMAGRPDALLLRGGPHGDVIASGSDGEPYRLSPSFLRRGHYPDLDHTRVSRDDTLTVTSDRVGWERRRFSQGELGDVVYPHTVVDSHQRTWVQYWCFYVFNDSVAGLGDTWLGNVEDHEGDWELVELMFDKAGKQPKRVRFSQHTSFKEMSWEDVQTDHGHPVVFPGRGTHSNNDRAGCHWVDCNDGHGRSVLPTVKVFSGAALWPGHWGTIPSPATRPIWHQPDWSRP